MLQSKKGEYMDSENNLDQNTAMDSDKTSLDTDQTTKESSENTSERTEVNNWVDSTVDSATDSLDEMNQENSFKPKAEPTEESTLESTKESPLKPTEEPRQEQEPAEESLHAMAQAESPVDTDTKNVVAEKKKISLTPLFILTTVAAVGALAYTVISDQTQRQQLNHNLSISKEETKKAQENLAKLEETVKSSQNVAKENKTTDNNTKLVAYDTKYQQLLDLMGKNKLIRSGQIFTNKTGTYAFASLQIGGFNKQKDNLGNEIEVVAGGSGVEEYYRELPNGEWKFAFGAQGIMKCSEFSAEIRKIYHDVERPDGQKHYDCMRSNDLTDTEHL